MFAVGYAVVYDVLGLMNLAHGDILMIATFVCLGTWEATDSPVIAVVAGLAVGAIAGSIVDQVAYRPLRYTGDTLAPLVASLGAALLLRNIAQSTFGVEDRAFPDLLPGGEIRLAGAGLPVAAVIGLVAAVGVAIGAQRLLARTRAGAVVMAVAQDLTAARLVGLPVGLAVLAVYAVAGSIAGLGGILYASTFGALKLSLGWSATVIAFTAAVIGGRGSLVGAALGGLALGIATTFLAYALPGGYRDAVAFVVLAGVLVIWPDRRGIVNGPD
ncbi:MAG: branched-chain amino acid ABC transporter permease [Actinomycetota bacterium]|nr:branched-chain amino acid ABC transporter permease [Actinomycetota bacterium]